MIILSIVDHSRSPRPSVLLSIYLSLTLLLDAAQARTLFLLANKKPELRYSSLFCATVALKAIILLLEAKQKSSWVQWNEKEHSPEETSGLFSIGVFFWLNRLFKLGYQKVLDIGDLYPLDSALDAKLLHDKFSTHIDYSRLKGDKNGLVKVLARTLAIPLVLPVLPRLAMLGFTFCQPLFMESLLDYLSQSELDRNTGYGYIGASLAIYFGIAICTAFYWYIHITRLEKMFTNMRCRYLSNRARTMIRSVLVTEIYSRATQARTGASDNSAALTLMSTDMERIRVGFRSLHEVWASLLQAALAAWMLYNRLGVVFVAPIAIVIICFIILAFLMNLVGNSQRAWMAAVQKRVGLTATVITNMKNLKISGLSAAISGFVQQLRVDELTASVLYRKIFISAALLGFAAQFIGPPVTFAFSQHSMDVSTMFTSLAFITLLTYPLSYIFEGIPMILTALACVGRIQAFLECETQSDYRKALVDIEKHGEKSSTGHDQTTNSAITIKNGNFGWHSDKIVLRHLNAEIPKSSLTIVVGPVGSGKSTFIKALIGEIPFAEGNVTTLDRLSRIGYCDQTAFLFNGSIRDNIVGFSPFDQKRYMDVVSSTALHFDFATLPRGDKTNIGSDGITLSGGQKQRVSLARALYLESDTLVLDDIFSGLDADTEARVFQQVFARDGLARKRNSTIVLCTHSVKHLPEADHILVLESGTVTAQGSFENLSSSSQYIQRLGLKSSSTTEISSHEESPLHSDQILDAKIFSPSIADIALESENNMARQVGDKTVYSHYVRSMGLHIAAFALLFSVCWGFFTNFPTICKFSLTASTIKQPEMGCRIRNFRTDD